MATCPYRYREGDALVISGKKKIGEMCELKYGKKEYDNYCPAHARLLGKISPEELKKESERREQTKVENKEASNKAKENAIKNDTLNDTVLEALNLKDPCNLKEEYAVFVALNQYPSYEDYDKKMAFARWLESPAHLREPKTTEEAAEILGVHPKTLFVWKTKPEIIDFINEDVRTRALGLFKLAIYKLGVNVDRGDVKSIESVISYCDKVSEEKKRKRKTLNIPEGLQKVADDYARSTSEGMNTGIALTAEKNMIITNHFNETMIPDKEN